VQNHIKNQEQEEQNQIDIWKQLKDKEDTNMKRNGLMEEMMKEKLMDVELWCITPLDGMEPPR